MDFLGYFYWLVAGFSLGCLVALMLLKARTELLNKAQSDLIRQTEGANALLAAAQAQREDNRQAKEERRRAEFLLRDVEKALRELEHKGLAQLREAQQLRHEADKVIEYIRGKFEGMEYRREVERKEIEHAGGLMKSNKDIAETLAALEGLLRYKDKKFAIEDARYAKLIGDGKLDALVTAQALKQARGQGRERGKKQDEQGDHADILQQLAALVGLAESRKADGKEGEDLLAAIEIIKAELASQEREG